MDLQQELFNLFSKEYGISLLQSELQEIIEITERHQALQLLQTDVSGSTYDAIELWNNAPTELTFFECNGYWKALRDLEKINIIKIGGLDAD